MATLIITEKTSQARDLRAALGDRFGQILPAEGHLLRLAEPHEVEASWKSWACVLLKPDGLYPTQARDRGQQARQVEGDRRGAEALRSGDPRHRLRPRGPADRPGDPRAPALSRHRRARPVHRPGPQVAAAGLRQAQAQPRAAPALRGRRRAAAGRPDLQPVADPHGDADAARPRRQGRHRHRPGQDADAGHRLLARDRDPGFPQSRIISRSSPRPRSRMAPSSCAMPRRPRPASGTALWPKPSPRPPPGTPARWPCRSSIAGRRRRACSICRRCRRPAASAGAGPPTRPFRSRKSSTMARARSSSPTPEPRPAIWPRTRSPTCRPSSPP